jgi:transposase
MFVRVKDKPNGRKSIQIVESWRRADKVSQRIIRHVGQAQTEREVEELKRLAESIIVEIENDRRPVLPGIEPESVYGSKTREIPEDSVKIKNLKEEQRIIDGIGDVFGKLYDDLGFKTIIGSKTWDEVLKACVMARLANPVSKHRTAAMLEEDYGMRIPLEKIYRMMDHLQEDAVKKVVAGSTLNLFSQKVDVLLFDVTTLYFQSKEADELKDFGFSKDMHFNDVQVVLALVTTTEGLPVAYNLFPGDICEGSTLIEMIREIKKLHDVENVLLVADRAMFTEKNLNLMEEHHINYIVAAKLKALSSSMKSQILESQNYKPAHVEREMHWAGEFSLDNRRLIVSYSSSRAAKDFSDRQRLIDRLMKKVKNGKVPIKSIIPNHGSKKYVKISKAEVLIDESKIEQDAKWDGLHGVITNSSKTVSEILTHYHGLWRIEETFRISKHDLKMRPVYHWTPERIRSHIMICFLSLAIARQSVYRLTIQKKPVSFEHLRNELLKVQSSVMIDISTKKRYLIPSKTTPLQKSIYQAFGLKRQEVPTRYI